MLPGIQLTSIKKIRYMKITNLFFLTVSQPEELASNFLKDCKSKHVGPIVRPM